MPNSKVHIKKGTYFPTPFIILGIIFLIASILDLFSIDSSKIFGIVFLFTGAYLTTSQHGIIIDVETKMISNYTSFLGIRKNNWISSDNYIYITLLTTRVKSTMGSRTNVSSSFSNNFYDITLLDKTHRNKMVVKRFENLTDAQKELTLLSEGLDLQIVKYNPVVSEKTKKRRY